MGQNPMELLDKLESGALPRQARLTIPEGWNRWQIADRVVALTGADRADFLRRVAGRIENGQPRELAVEPVTIDRNDFFLTKEFILDADRAGRLNELKGVFNS